MKSLCYTKIKNLDRYSTFFPMAHCSSLCRVTCLGTSEAAPKYYIDDPPYCHIMLPRIILMQNGEYIYTGRVSLTRNSD